MKILFVTPEVAPLARTNNLADFSYYLPQHLINQGVDVRIVTPLYKSSNLKKTQTVDDFGINMFNRVETCILKKVNINKMVVYLIQNYQYFERDFMYAYDDDCERFAFFSKAVIHMLKHIDFKPDVIHLNDWNSAGVSIILNEKSNLDKFYKNIAITYTIHNLGYQGICSRGFLKVLGVGDSVFDIKKAEYYNMINHMKIGIIYSDVVTTVSKSYAKEIQTRDFGNGLDGILRSREKDLFGIINGIDYKKFNPKIDDVLKKNYDSGNLESKAFNKTFLQDKLNLPRKDVPIIVFAAPLTDEKGVELLLESIDDICENDVQLVIIGIGNAVYEYSLKFAMSKYKYQIFTLIGEDEELLRQVFAAGDIFLAPYRWEPSGVNELIAIRYGLIVVARNIGLLKDCVIDQEKRNGYGYMFDKFSKDSMLEELKKAIECYGDKKQWNTMVKRALKANFSWSNTAKEYKNIYSIAIKNREKSFDE